MKDIAIFGAGGFGREVACLINSINECIDCKDYRWNLIGFFDDVKEKGFKTEFGEVLGGTNDLNKWPTPINLAIAIGTPKAVKVIYENVNNPNVSFPNIIHPNFRRLDEATFTIGKGNIITANCSVSCAVSIGNFNILNSSVGIGHDAKVGSFNAFMPAVRISGGVRIGDCNFFGVSSAVLQQIEIGDDIKLGAGSVLMTPPKNGQLYMGNPARKTEF